MRRIRSNPKIEVLYFVLGLCALGVTGGCSPGSLPFQRQPGFKPITLANRRAETAIAESQAMVVENLANSPEAVQIPNQRFDPITANYWDLSLDEIVRIAMSNRKVLRDLGGRLVSQPNQAVTINNPDLVRSDARSGVDAALSAFDPQWKAAINFNSTQNGLRNPIVGSSITTIQQERGLGSVGYSKIGQSGTRYSVTSGNIYDSDNVGVPPSRFHSAFDTFLSLEGRHPFGRGGGAMYNAIAGPNSAFGTYNGYLIASIRSDIAEDELRIALRDYVFSVIRIYWLLRFAHDNVQARLENLELSSELVRIAREKQAEGAVDELVVLQAQDKYFAAQQAYDNAVVGAPERALSGILGPNGALISGAELGLQSLERRLRLLVGIPSGQGGFIRPVESLVRAPIQIDYASSLQTALSMRAELQRQTRSVEQKRMEWVAARNLRLPSVDLIGGYRVHGFGQKLLGDPNRAQDSSVSEFLRGDLQDLTAGVEIIRPAGNRLAKTAELNAMKSIVRESTILDQQRLQISYELSSAIAEVERSQRVMCITAARLENAGRTLESLKTKYEEGIAIPIENLVEAARNVSDLELADSIATVDYSIAIYSLAVAKGTLLSDVAVFCEGEQSMAQPNLPSQAVMNYASDVPRTPVVIPAPVRNPVQDPQDTILLEGVSPIDTTNPDVAKVTFGRPIMTDTSPRMTHDENAAGVESTSSSLIAAPMIPYRR